MHEIFMLIIINIHLLLYCRFMVCLYCIVDVKPGRPSSHPELSIRLHDNIINLHKFKISLIYDKHAENVLFLSDIPSHGYASLLDTC